MTRRLRWSREALDDLKAQVAFIAADNPGAARRVADVVRAAAEGLAEMPTGRPGRVAGTWLCCANQPGAEAPLTPVGVMRRALSRGYRGG